MRAMHTNPGRCVAMYIYNELLCKFYELQPSAPRRHTIGWRKETAPALRLTLGQSGSCGLAGRSAKRTNHLRPELIRAPQCKTAASPPDAATAVRLLRTQFICIYIFVTSERSRRYGRSQFHLQMTSMRPSPWSDEKLGASADTSHRYRPLDFSVNRFSLTRTLLE